MSMWWRDYNRELPELPEQQYWYLDKYNQVCMINVTHKYEKHIRYQPPIVLYLEFVEGLMINCVRANVPLYNSYEQAVKAKKKRLASS